MSVPPVTVTAVRSLVARAGEAASRQPLPDEIDPAEAGRGETSPDVLDLPGEDECWSVLCTLSRREKKIARAREHLAVRHYLPLREGRNGAPGSGAPSTTPLFPGYVFAYLERESRVTLLRTGTIAKVIPVPRPRLLLDELRQIRSALAVGADLAPGPAIARGMRVRVVGGALDRVEGTVAGRWMRRGRLGLVLNDTMLGRGATVVVDASEIEPVPAGGAGPLPRSAGWRCGAGGSGRGRLHRSAG